MHNLCSLSTSLHYRLAPISYASNIDYRAAYYAFNAPEFYPLCPNYAQISATYLILITNPTCLLTSSVPLECEISCTKEVFT